MNVLFTLLTELDGYTLGHIQKRLEADNSKAYQLFQIYKSYKGKADLPNDEQVMKKLYSSSSADMGVLYRLKNRLVNNINQVLIELNTSEGKTSFLSEQNLILFRIFQARRVDELSEYYLQKSIKYAEANEQYSLLDILYGEMINYCKETLVENPDVFIQKRRSNFTMFNNLRIIDEILAVMTYRLKLTQNLGDQLDISEEIAKTMSVFASDKDLFKSKQFKIKFYKTVSQILVQQQKFEELEKFIIDTRKDFIKDGIFTKQTHDIKIEQLVYLTNALLVQRKYDEVIENGKILYNEIQEYDKLLYDKYIYYYYQAQINSYAVLNTEKAIELQLEVLEKNIIKDPYFIVFNFANLAFLHFMQRNYKQVVRTLQKVYLNDYYPKVDTNLKVELSVLELTSRFDLADVNTFEYRLAQIKSSLQSEWKEYDGIEKSMLNLIFAMSGESNYSKDKKLIKLAKDYLKLSASTTNRVFNYENWLREKFSIQ